jgi:hypothetical protein
VNARVENGQLRNLITVDCNTIDPSDETLYVVSGDALFIMRFDRPIRRDAEMFEQSYNA